MTKVVDCHHPGKQCSECDPKKYSNCTSPTKEEGVTPNGKSEEEEDVETE